MTFRPIEPSKYFDDKIAKQIINWEWLWYYKPMLDALRPVAVNNDNNVIFEAIKSGTLYYQNGAFYSKSGRFSNRIALELEKIGARYSKYGRCYRIIETKLPTNIAWIIETTKAKVFSDVITIKKILDFSIGSLNEIIKHLKVADVVEAMFQDLQDRTYKMFQQNKIQTIAPKMTDFRAKEMAENYTDSLEYYIKDWQQQEIVKMREVVGQMAIDGESRVTIANYIESQFKVSQRKAKFLARNESSIAVAGYLKAKYEEEGFEEFKWITNIDGRERELHKELNGKIFRFDDPPIIDERTGQRGLPGETYNCRCKFIPVLKSRKI